MVLLVVLGTAVLHAGWNTIAKSIGDRWVASALIAVVNLVAGAVGVAVLGLPVPATWPYLAASAVLQSTYLVVLTRAYAHGELSRVYPIARGTSPVLVTLVAVLVLREPLSPLGSAGIAVLVGGIAVVAGRRGSTPPVGIGLAVLTGMIIAGYTVVDGIGVRQGPEPYPYIAALFLLQGPLTLALCWWRGGPRLLVRTRARLGPGLLGGVLSVLSYGIVVWAQSRAPLALVSAMRETSVIWAVLAGQVLLGERLRRTEVGAVLLAALGAVLVQLA